MKAFVIGFAEFMRRHKRDPPKLFRKWSTIRPSRARFPALPAAVKAATVSRLVRYMAEVSYRSGDTSENCKLRECSLWSFCRADVITREVRETNVTKRQAQEVALLFKYSLLCWQKLALNTLTENRYRIRTKHHSLDHLISYIITPRVNPYSFVRGTTRPF